MAIDVEVPPYRVEWRANLTTRWLLINTAGTREDADGLARDVLREHRGYCRLISQHVIASSERPGHWEAPDRTDAGEGGWRPDDPIPKADR
jgi:hypothetical protein